MYFTATHPRSITGLAERARTIITRMIVAGALSLMAISAPADQTADAEPDWEYAEDINNTCAGCHGEFGEGSLDGEYPRLAGLDETYMAQQLRDFKSRKRLNIPMTPYTTERELPEEDVKLIAAYLARLELPTKLPPIDESKFNAFERLEMSRKVVNIAQYPGDIEAGGKFYRKECASCHGKAGWGDSEEHIPQLAGQRSQYLLHQMEKIASAERFHDEADDAEVFRAYTDEDIQNMLAFLSVQDDD